jgi:uncharacterized protein (DUF4415 family)
MRRRQTIAQATARVADELAREILANPQMRAVVADRVAQAAADLQAERPTHGAPKVPISIRINPATLDAFRATGPGWQGRMNEVLDRAAATLEATHGEPV